MKLFGIIFENDEGEFEIASGQGSSAVGELRIFKTIEKAERSRNQLRHRPHLKDKTLLFGIFELENASEDINEIIKLKENEENEPIKN